MLHETTIEKASGAYFWYDGDLFVYGDRGGLHNGKEMLMCHPVADSPRGRVTLEEIEIWLPQDAKVQVEGIHR
jgi:hypothetical protein